MDILKGIKENQKGYIEINPTNVIIENPHTLTLVSDKITSKNINDINSNDISLVINTNDERIIINGVYKIETRTYLYKTVNNDFMPNALCDQMVKYKETKIQFHRNLTLEELDNIMLKCNSTVNTHTFSSHPALMI